MFDAIGLAPHLTHPGCPIRTIRVADGLAPGALAFEPPEGDDEPLGWMHENRHLRAALRARAEAAGNVTLHWKSKAATIDRGDHGVTVTLDDGETLTAALLVAAEGRNSPPARRPESASRAGNMTMPRSSRRSPTSARTRMSRGKSSTRAARSPCCR